MQRKKKKKSKIILFDLLYIVLLFVILSFIYSPLLDYTIDKNIFLLQKRTLLYILKYSVNY